MRPTTTRLFRHGAMRPAATVLCCLLLAACDGSGGGADASAQSGDGDGLSGGAGNANAGTPPVVIEGDIARFGVINVADRAGQASDAIAAFYSVSPSIGQAEFGGLSAGDAADCRVVSAVQGGNALTSSVFIPAPGAASVASIRAGETVGLMSAAGSWIELTPTDAGGMTFYSPDEGVPDGPVPDPLTADVSAAIQAGGFVQFANAALPGAVAMLENFSPAGNEAVSAGTTFSWQAGNDSSARVLIAASESFFADDPMRVACVVPDTGAFAFPAATRGALGNDFAGVVTGASRLVVGVEQQGDTLLFLIRESSTD